LCLKKLGLAMRKINKIITVGLSPAWDITCRGRQLDWGQHKVISSADSQAAGKALNISQALAWMGTKTIAAGLWGRDDYGHMLKSMSPLRKLVAIRMTAVDGATRQNITIIDTANKREMHLRAASDLASEKTLMKLRTDLRRIVTKNSVCVFAGSMPPKKLWGSIVAIINCCRGRGAKIAVDTSGPALKRIVDSGNIWLIKPNIEELRELIGEQIKDTPISLIKVGRELLEEKRIDILLISRGEKGAIAITKQAAWQGQYFGGHKKVLSTVGCGDFLLAGFLKAFIDKPDLATALETAIKVATARALGWTERLSWAKVRRRIKVRTNRM
jgi:1-phosphofructokinase